MPQGSLRADIVGRAAVPHGMRLKIRPIATRAAATAVAVPLSAETTARIRAAVVTTVTTAAAMAVTVAAVRGSFNSVR